MDTKTGFIEFTAKDRTDNIAHILIEKGANVNVINNDGDSALILAAKKSKDYLWNTFEKKVN